MLLMLVMLGVFIQSSQAVKCYKCKICDYPGSSTETCEGKVCEKVTLSAAGGAFTICRIKVSFMIS